MTPTKSVVSTRTPGGTSPSSMESAALPPVWSWRLTSWMGGLSTLATLERIPALVSLILGHGWLGVDLFFVLSGFLITGILLDARDKPGYFRNFYARRFLRIIPLYFCVMVIMWVCYKGPAAFFLLSLVFLANFNLAFRVHVPHGAGVFWSLSVEEHFYLIWPWLVRFLSRRALTIVAASIVTLVPCIRLLAAASGTPATKIYEYSYFRFDGLALGALLAIWVRSPRASTRSSLWLAAFLVAASIVITIVGLPFGIMSQHNPMRFTQAELVFAAFVLFAVCRRGSAITAPLRWRFAKLCGDLSYCIYLIHLSLGDAFEHFRRLGGGAPMVGGAGLVVRGIFIVTATFAIASLSHRFFEQPILRFKRYFEYNAQRHDSRGQDRQYTNAAAEG